MDSRALVRQQFGLAHNVLEQVLADVTAPVAASVPAGTIKPIAIVLAHVVSDEDFMVNGMAQGAPLLLSRDGWSERTGIPVPGGPFMTDEWAANVKLDLDAFREYMKAVFAQTDAFLAEASDEQLAREVPGPLGTTSAFNLLATIGLYHCAEHTGEIAALKGVQELKGLPF